MTAQDLVFTFSHILACPHETPDKTLLRNIARDGVRVTGDRTVEVALEQPDSNFALLIKDSFYSIVPEEELLPSGSGLDGPSSNSGSHLAWKRHPVGAGPYRTVRVSDDGAVVETEAARDLPEGAPKSIRFSTGDCPPDADVALGYDDNPLPGRLRKNVIDTPLAIMGLYFDYTHPLARNADFRVAVSLALDRAAISALVEDSKPANGMIPSDFLAKFKKKPAPPPGPDPRRAADLFKKVMGASLDSPVAIPVGSRAIDGQFPPWIVAVEKQMNQAGFPARMTPGRGTAPFSVAGFIPGIPDLGRLFALFREGTGWVSRLDERDGVYDELLARAATLRDSPEREEVLRALNERFQARAYAVPLYEEPVVLWTNPARVASIGARQGISLAYERLRITP